MATGQSMQLAKQVGEYLVAAELSRRGFIATTFAGNVPHFDILATSPQGKHVAIQVKTIRKGTWQLDATRFVQITLDGTRQVIGRKTRVPYPNLICVFVILAAYGTDRFFILEWRKLQSIVAKSYRRNIEARKGVRPRSPESTHTIVSPEQLRRYDNAWHIIESQLERAA